MGKSLWEKLNLSINVDLTLDANRNGKSRWEKLNLSINGDLTLDANRNGEITMRETES